MSNLSERSASPGEWVSARIAKLLDVHRAYKRSLMVALDVVLCVVSAFIAFSLRVGALAFPAKSFAIFVGVSIVCTISALYLYRAYSAIFRFSGWRAIRDLGRATVSFAVFLIAIFMLYGVPGVPRTIAIIYPIIFFGLASFSRLAIRHVLTEVGDGGEAVTQRRIAMIYGAGSSGLQLATALRTMRGFRLVGFVDDDKRLHRQRLEGLPVVHSSHLAEFVSEAGVNTMLLAIPNLRRRRRKEIIDHLRQLNVRVQILPSVRHLVDERVSVSDLREVQIEDILGREFVPPNPILLSRSIFNKRVMVTGAGGSIGQELARQILTLNPKELTLVDMSEHALYLIGSELQETLRVSGSRTVLKEKLVNLTDRPVVDRLFDEAKPDTVFHAAAYKHVPLVEHNILSGLKNNILATRNVAQAAENAGVHHFVLISTDKAVRPTNVMGASKRVCELILQAKAKGQGATRYAMVRFGNVLGSSGSVVPRFHQQIREAGPVTITHKDMTRFFMTIPEAAQLVLQAGSMADGGEVYLLDMGEPVRIVDLARAMIELTGLSVRDEANPDGDIEIVEVGLRPGEKLFEELLIDAHAQETSHPQIFRAIERSVEPEELAHALEIMEKAIEANDSATALRILEQLVPEYGPAPITQTALLASQA